MLMTKGMLAAMSIFIIILFSSLIIILSGVTFFLFKKNSTPIQKYFRFLFLNTIFWNLCVLLMILVPSDNIKVFLYYSKYISISTIPAFSIICILLFLKLDNYITKKNLTLLFIIPAVYILIVYTNNFHHLFASKLTIKTFAGLRIVSAVHSWAFYINAAYTYIIIFIDLFLLTLNWMNVADIYKKQMRLLFMTMLIPSLVNFIYVYFGLSQKIFDLTPLFFSFTLIFIAYDTSHYNLTDIVPISRRDIFKTNITPIIVLDIHERIIDMNPSAEKIFNNSLSNLCGKNISVLNSYYDNNTASNNDVRISINSKVYMNSKVYNVKHSIIYNNNGTSIGSYKSFYDITTEEEYLNELKYLSFHDALTGLYNRTYYNIVIEKIQSKENLPLCIILGDLNGLKTINDTLGHKAGDEFIKLAADILSKSLNDTALIFRLGGDEFCILLPKTAESDLKIMLQNIYRNFANTDKYNISISLGYAIKKDVTESYTHLFSKADANMYVEKIRIKNT